MCVRGSLCELLLPLEKKEAPAVCELRLQSHNAQSSSCFLLGRTDAALFVRREVGGCKRRRLDYSGDGLEHEGTTCMLMGQAVVLGGDFSRVMTCLYYHRSNVARRTQSFISPIFIDRQKKCSFIAWVFIYSWGGKSEKLGRPLAEKTPLTHLL